MLTPVFLCKHITIAQWHCYKTVRYKLVELLFSAKSYPTKGMLELKWLNERDPYLFTPIIVKIHLTINIFSFHSNKNKSDFDLNLINRPALADIFEHIVPVGKETLFISIYVWYTVTVIFGQTGK